MGTDGREVRELFSHRAIAARAATSIVAGWLLVVLAIHPTWILINLFLLFLFLIMSILCISYIVYLLYAFDIFLVRGIAHSDKFFYSFSNSFVVLVALLSSYCCLYSIDPTNRTFYGLCVLVIFIGAGGIVTLMAVNKRKPDMITMVFNGRSFPLIVLILCVTLSRFALFMLDTAPLAIAYCAFSILLITWLVLELCSLTQLAKASDDKSGDQHD